jgi:acyl-CoA thioesterase
MDPQDGEQDVAERSARAMWDADAASRMLGMQVVSVGPGTAAVSMTVRDDMVNGWDLCHGGLVAALADSAFAVACNSGGTVTVAAGFDVDLLEPAHRGDELVARATETAMRGRSGVYDVVVTRASDGTVVALFRGRSRSLGRPNPGLADRPRDVSDR